MWRSLVAHLLWEQGAAGSNPATPTILTLVPAARVCPFCARQHRPGWFSLQAKSATRPRVVSVRAAIRQSTPDDEPAHDDSARVTMTGAP